MVRDRRLVGKLRPAVSKSESHLHVVVTKAPLRRKWLLKQQPAACRSGLLPARPLHVQVVGGSSTLHVGSLVVEEERSSGRAGSWSWRATSPLVIKISICQKKS
jgi:hypothetical protein